MSKTLELRTLEDEDLLDVVGGCGGCHCERPQHYSPCGDDRPSCGFGVEVLVFVGII